jgi:hypothetical protein
MNQQQIIANILANNSDMPTVLLTLFKDEVEGEQIDLASKEGTAWYSQQSVIARYRRGELSNPVSMQKLSKIVGKGNAYGNRVANVKAGFEMKLIEAGIEYMTLRIKTIASTTGNPYRNQTYVLLTR